MRLCLIAMVTTLTATSALAQGGLGPIPGEERFEGLTGTDEELKGSGAAQVGFSKIGEDSFVTVTPRFDLNFGQIGLGLQVPLNLRVIDEKPKNDDDYAGIIREEDWDEPTEYLRAIRYFRYGHKRSPFYLRVGELAAELGHGTIMTRYMNNLDFNTFHLGLQLDVNTDYGGVETVINDVGQLMTADDGESRVVGARAYVKPLAFVDPESIFNIFQVGATVVRDLDAPFTLAVDADGDPVVNEEDELVVADDDDPRCLESPCGQRSLTVYGFDIGVELLRSPILDVTPYTDLNFIDQAGWGWHLGVQAVAKFPLVLDIVIPARLEYRRFKQDYIPSYFSTFYELERYSFPIGAGVTPKSRFVRGMDDAEGINGYYGDLAFGFANLLQIGAIYEDYEGSNPNVAAFLKVPALDVIQFKAYYTRTGVEDFEDVFKLDERSMLIAQARYELFMYTYLVARWSRQWVLETNQNDKDFGSYQPEDSWKVGLELSFDF